MAFHSTHREGYWSKLLFFHWKGSRCTFWGLLHWDDHDKLVAMDLSMIAVALTPSWLVWILTVMPVWLSSFFFFRFYFWTRKFIYPTSGGGGGGGWGEALNSSKCNRYFLKSNGNECSRLMTIEAVVSNNWPSGSPKLLYHRSLRDVKTSHRERFPWKYG